MLALNTTKTLLKTLTSASLRPLSTAQSQHTLPPGSTITVTGASGYLGSYTCAELLSRGYKVIAAVRTQSEAAHLLKLPNGENLSIVHGCDLDKLDTFDSAFTECTGVIHCAAKVALGVDPSIVGASVFGTNNVLASVDKRSNIKAFVSTSSCAAIQTYDVKEGHVFTEEDWNDWSSIERGDGYGVAKTAGERLVHSYFARDKNDTRHYACVNPNVSIGPVMTKEHSVASVLMLRDVIYGNKTMYFPSSFVDVRDVAKGHVEALLRPEADKGRHILVGDHDPTDQNTLVEIANRLFPQYEFACPPKVNIVLLRNLLIPLSHLPIVGSSVLSEFAREVSQGPSTYHKYKYDNSRSKKVLGMEYRSLETSVKEGVESMIGQGFAKAKARK